MLPKALGVEAEALAAQPAAAAAVEPGGLADGQEESAEETGTLEKGLPRQRRRGLLDQQPVM